MTNRFSNDQPLHRLQATFTVSRCAAAAAVPHSGHRPGVARRSYPHRAQHPFRHFRRRRHHPIARHAGSGNPASTNIQYGTTTPNPWTGFGGGASDSSATSDGSKCRRCNPKRGAGNILIF
jgi:hypothetical protein